MSEIYSSASGSYSSYLAQRQNDEIKQQIQKSANQQSFVTAMTGAYLGSQIDSVNRNIVRMSTGIQNSIDTNTYAIAASSEMLKETFDAGFDAVNNKLDLGFAGVTDAIGSMSASMTAGFNLVATAIDYWGEKICEKLDVIHDIVNNPLLTASRELYRRAAKNSEKKFYEEALEDIKSAVEKNKTDYISWGLMGKIYLFGMSEFSNVVDVSKAQDSFKNACKYISPDIDESDEAKRMASEFYFYLGYSNYVLANEKRIAGEMNEYRSSLEAASNAFVKSYALSSALSEALYNKIRCNALLENKETVLNDLRVVLKQDSLYSVRVLTDPDLSAYTDEIINLINEMRDNLAMEIKKDITEFNDYKYKFLGGKFAEWLESQIDYINKNKNKFNNEKKYPYCDTYFFYNILCNVLEITRNKSFAPDYLCDQKQIYLEECKDGHYLKVINDFVPFAQFSKYSYTDPNDTFYWKNQLQLKENGHAVEWRIMPELQTAIDKDFLEHGWVTAGIGYDKTNRELYFGLTFVKGDLLELAEPIKCAYLCAKPVEKHFSPQKQWWLENIRFTSLNQLQEFRERYPYLEVPDFIERNIEKNGDFESDWFQVCQNGQKYLLHIDDYDEAYALDYFIIDNETIIAGSDPLLPNQYVKFFVFTSGVEISTVKEEIKLEEERRKKAEIKKQEEAQKKEEERIAAEQSASERAYEAEVAKKNRIIYIFGIILFIPLVILGRHLLQKSGMFIFAFLDIGFISYFVAKALLGGIGGSSYRPQKFLLGWGLYQKKNVVLHISMTLALSILGAKLGSFIRHGFLGFLAGVIFYILLVGILNAQSKRYV